MNPAHNSYNGPETQDTKFTHHREQVGGAQVVDQGEVISSSGQTGRESLLNSHSQ